MTRPRSSIPRSFRIFALGCGVSLLVPCSARISAETSYSGQQADDSPVQIQAKGDIATFRFHGPADRVDLWLGGEAEGHAFARLPGGNTWILDLKRPGLDRAVFSFRLISTLKGQTAKQTPASQPRVWRGPNAPSPPEIREVLEGTFDEADLDSKALGTRRRITTYLPPRHDRARPCPVVYAADGESVKEFSKVLEPMISTGRIPPVVIVGVHSGGYLGPIPDVNHYDMEKDLRAQEYFPGLNAKRFSDHESFFIKEVPDWSERRFGVSTARTDRAVFGTSNGGRFAVEMGLRHPDSFGHALCFSIAGDASASLPAQAKPAETAQFYLTAGTWEGPFHESTSKLANAMKARAVPLTFNSRVGGHDTAIWREEFAAAVDRAFFGTRRSPD